MNLEKLHKYKFISGVVTALSGVVSLIAATLIVYSVRHDMWLSDAPEIVIKAIGYIPAGIFMAAILADVCLKSAIEKQKNEDRIAELERQVKQLKR
jgi:branched-subunit amino acid transport protein